MTRTMSPDQIEKLTNAHGRRHRPRRDARSGDPLPRLQHRRPVGEVEGRPPGDGPDRRPRRLVSEVYGTAAEPLYSHGPGGHHRSHQLVLQQVRRPDVGRGQAAERGGHQHPGEATLHYTTDHYGAATEEEFESSRSSSTTAACSTSTSRAPRGRRSARPQQKGEYDGLRHGLVPRLPRRRQLPRAVPRQGQLPRLAVRQQEDPRPADPASPAARPTGTAAARAIRQSRTSSPRTYPVLPLWQGKQYVAARDDVTGAA